MALLATATWNIRFANGRWDHRKTAVSTESTAMKPHGNQSMSTRRRSGEVLTADLAPGSRSGAIALVCRFCR
jgi:hypothetical protein